MIHWFEPAFWGKEEEYVTDALKSTWISDGQYISRFEHLFSEILNCRQTVTVNNGTSALHLALLALDIKPGDEVIVPSYTFAAPINMVKMMGAKPVFVDVDAKTWCLDETKMESAITAKTKAIIPVHTYGNVCNMPAIMDMARTHQLAVIEDTAEALFSKCNNKAAGTFGDIGCFSFQATKTITMGEGGALTIENESLAERARLIRSHGMQGKKRYWHYEIGHNFRLTNYQAALGCAQLEYLDTIILNKQRVFQAYKERLSHIAGLSFQHIPDNVDPVIWAVALRLDKNAFAGDVEWIRNRLMAANIETRSGFFTFYDMPLYEAPLLPIAQDLSESIISLPSYALMSDHDIDYVCQKILQLRN